MFLSVALTFFPLKTNAEDVALVKSEGVLTYYLQIPPCKFESVGGGTTRISMDGADYGIEPGCPNLPTLAYTFALPPGTRTKSIEVTGERTILDGSWELEVQPLPLPLIDGAKNTFLESMYTRNIQDIYSSSADYPQELGTLLSAGCRREYSLATVVLYPLAYNPGDKKLYRASNLCVKIHYAPLEEDAREEIERYISEGSIYADVPENIYNKNQARTWYRPEERLQAQPGILILTTDALLSSIDGYIKWREGMGYLVKAVTKEQILASGITGLDLEEQIRNWLRKNAADYEYLFIIASNDDIPMRTMYGYGNDPNQDPGWYYPGVTDIYYGELSRNDAHSWDSDGDGYYGEVLPDGSGPTVDNPDLEMELHVGRINTSEPTKVKSILDKIRKFETTSDQAYKRNAVTSASIPFYKTTDGEGLDGAIFMEYLQDAEILDRGLTTTLYEKGGDMPSAYDCDLPETHENLVSTLQNNNVGVFVEYNHGSPVSFARFIVHDKNGNGFFESGEEEWFDCLTTGDAWNLNGEHPNVAFLMSCVNGRPEEKPVCIAQALLNYGSVAVVAHTRVSYSGGWHTPANGGFECLFYEDIKAFAHDGIPIGEAVSKARPVLREKEPQWFFLNGYPHVLYGDPAMNLVGVPVAAAREPLEPRVCNPLLYISDSKIVTYDIPAASYIRLEVWDVSGRKVQTLYEGYAPSGKRSCGLNPAALASGTYFLTLRYGSQTCIAKTVLVH